MYYVIQVVRLSIALHRQAQMRLPYQREYVCERATWRDSLVSSEVISPAVP